MVHGSMTDIKNKHNILYSQTIGISIVRPGGPGTDLIYNNKTYKIFK